MESIQGIVLIIKKIVRLTENDLVRLVKKIVKEQTLSYDSKSMGCIDWTEKDCMCMNGFSQDSSIIIEEIAEACDCTFNYFSSWDYKKYRKN